MTGALKILVLPPASVFAIALVGILLARRRPVLARALFAASGVSLYLLCTPLVGALLLRTLESDPIWSPEREADAVVVLSGDASVGAEYGGPTVGASTLERLRYAAWLHRKTGAPLLVTGGRGMEEREALAPSMKAVLENDFGVAVRWAEPRSRNTFENARYSAEILEREGIRRIYLVTHGWHMPRARRCFEAMGLEVVSAPTALSRLPVHPLRALIPTARSLTDSSNAVHEWIGRLWYRLTYLRGAAS